jgi:hypothetical protein
LKNSKIKLHKSEIWILRSMGVVKYSFKVEKKISLHMIIVAAHGIVKAT